MYYKIGVDVGGTNTDAVLVSHENEIIAKTKQTTSLDISSGIENAIKKVLSEVTISKKDIKYIMLGTTHCTNALVERKELNNIGVIRLALPASGAIPTMADFPNDLKILLDKHVYMVHGGYEFDGHLISPLIENEVKSCLEKMKGEVDSVAITGIFSKTIPDQELQVAQWSKEILGNHVKVTCSHEIGGLGLLERENAAILNASLQGVALKMVNAFKETVSSLGLISQLFIGQNDGTLLSLEEVQDYPVLTISSGPTNSIRGAGALSKVENGIVIDVGGTTSDGGVLINHFPRESTQAAQIGGVLTNFRMPDVVAVGVGGGTIVRFIKDKCVLGPDSVGYRLKEKAIAFKGDTLTLSDFFIAQERLAIEGSIRVGELKNKMEELTKYSYPILLNKVIEAIQNQIENLVDKLKTDSKDIPVIACGGGAFLLPNNIKGASEVIFPKHMEVANAFGACISQISSEKEIVINSIQKNEKEELASLLLESKNDLIHKGASKNSIHIIAKESTPLAYLPGATKLKVKLCGDLIQ
ncbi:N-methylhydantoinase A/oxoprolinase/acetone carboxylase, beta subunit [Tenacibaculum sp. MAR_2009_124]|uniref:hydantoinase/oxoprolinase family protein n=1 Tax=Tenacibaculum sp. MAR_2009_124 TaxID=1250059 RepID=UPI000897BD13|nr:hydantoinase/oxoprolinase family protein [Tenacibaculum sp. MAR_2009_124]SEC00856.1 N-methylhydantoinase A/oxoprolinase/acetone carboxylase, beta subunit [Tenacibaculum sp. MAR_2009_124]